MGNLGTDGGMATALEAQRLIAASNGERIEAQRFEHLVEHFIKHWGPADRREAAEFAAHLHSIVRATYHDAQRPVFERYEKLLMTMAAHAPLPFGAAAS